MTFDVDSCLDRLIHKKELLEEELVQQLCERLKEVLVEESNVIHVSSPITVVGDVHGQFHDVLEIFQIGGFLPDTNYLFLGDYVDRGVHSVETITLLSLLKLRYPSRIFLLRGNHESRAVTRVYGFYMECMRKYGTANVWQYYMEMFDYLTLSCVIDDSIFCIHGGLSPNIHSIDQLRILDRFGEIPHEGPICDLMWSDPEGAKTDFSISPRGSGYTYGKDVVDHFLYTNQMKHILRAHQLCMEGYQILFDDKLSTVWSAPNYCYRCGNMASILEVDGDSRHFNIFAASPDNLRQQTRKTDAGSVLGSNGGIQQQASQKRRASLESNDSGIDSSTANIGNQYFL